MIWLMVLSALVGATYDQAIRGTPYDASRRSPALQDTLNGPQTPGRVLVRGGRSLIVFETCTRHLCGYQHAVTVIDPRTRESFVMVYNDDGKTVVVANPEIERLIGDLCFPNRCDF